MESRMRGWGAWDGKEVESEIAEGEKEKERGKTTDWTWVWK